jgi:hypothetical protein
MSVHAGTILTVGGNNVIDRIQSAGLGDVRLPIETIREVGNRLVVDKIPGEPDFTFTLESLDVSSDLMAWLTGKTGAIASGSAPGSGDPVGTSYDWTTCGFTNIISPWKDATTGSAGTIQAGHIVPGYYPNRLRYRFGVTDNATQEVELGGGSFYYGGFAPVEQYGTGTGPFTTSDNTVHHRLGGVAGSIVVRSKDATAFLALLSSVTGVSTTEVIGFFNQNPVTLEVQIQNPKDPGSILKTLYVADAIFQVPGTPARVNTPTDFSITWDSRDGTFLEYKGAKP